MKPRLYYIGAFVVGAGSLALSAFLFYKASMIITEVQA